VKPTKLGLHFSDVSMSSYDFSKVLDLVGRKLRLRSLSIGPWFTNRSLEFTIVPSGGGASSPVVNGGRSRATNDGDVQLGSPEFDWWRGRRWLRRVAAARLRWCYRGDLNSGESRHGSGKQATREARWCPRGEVGGVSRRRELEDSRAHCGGDNGGLAEACTCTCAGREELAFIGGGRGNGALRLCLEGRGGEERAQAW
jgi:hypothetical protein